MFDDDDQMTLDGMELHKARHIYTIRHCERLDNLNQVWYLNHATLLKDNPPLSDRGELQAIAIGESLAFTSLSYIFSSPYERCVQTAAYIHKYLIGKSDSLKINIEPGFLESAYFCYKELEFPWPSFETAQQLASRPEYSGAIDLDYRPAYNGYGEKEMDAGLRGCWGRVRETMERIVSKCEGDILIVAHTTTLDAIDQYLTAIYSDHSQSLNPGQATITKYEESVDLPGTFSAIYRCDCSHLSVELRQQLRGSSTIRV